MIAARAAIVGVAGLALGAGAAVVMQACADDVDPGDAAAPTDAEAGSDASAADAPVDAPRSKDRCTADVDCKPPNGCYSPHCDVVLGACTYALCEPKGRACAAGRCNTTTMTCSDANDYAFRTTRYKLAAMGLGCPSNATACFAAIYPFVFVGTKSDVLVLRADDLVATSPSPVAHTGGAVKPARLVASGRRLWIVGDAEGAAAPRRLPVSWIDVPSDPTVRSVAVQSTVIAWPYAESVAFAAPDAGLFLASGDANEGYPTTILRPPFPAKPTAAVSNPADAAPPSPPPTHPMVRVNAPPGSVLAGSSGSRLLVDRATVFNVITGAGTPSAELQADQALQPPWLAFSVPRFAQGPDGVVLLTAPIIADPPLPDCNCTTHERLAWILPNAVANGVDAYQAIDGEGYTSPQLDGGTCHQCVPNYVTLPSLATWIDAKTVLLAAPASGPPPMQALTAVRVLSRDPLAANGRRRFVPAATETPSGNFAVDRIALASSNGLGYLLVADAQGDNVNLSIFDPRCDTK